MSPIIPRTDSCQPQQRTLCTAASPLRFSPVTPADMELIMPYLQLQPWRTTDFSYGGLLMWVDMFRYEYCIFADTLFIKGVVEDDMHKTAFSVPLGSLPLAESVALLKEYCAEEGLTLEFSAVPEEAVEHFRNLCPAAISELQGWGDYLYDAEALAFLRGKKLGKKRNHVNRFETLYPDWHLDDLRPDDVDDVLRFMDSFDREGDATPMAIAERAMTRRIVELMRNENRFFCGAILRASDQIAAFTIGDIIGDTLYIHIEKALRRFDGSYEAINTLFARQMLLAHPDLRYINREDDANDPGLRKAKQSYHPNALLRKFNIIFP